MKDNNRRSGKGRAGCPFFEELDAILGSRAASEPPLLLESASGSCSRPDIEGICINYFCYISRNTL